MTATEKKNQLTKRQSIRSKSVQEGGTVGVPVFTWDRYHNEAGKVITQAREQNTLSTQSRQSGTLRPDSGSRPRRWVPTQKHRKLDPTHFSEGGVSAPVKWPSVRLPRCGHLRGGDDLAQPQKWVQSKPKPHGAPWGRPRDPRHFSSWCSKTILRRRGIFEHIAAAVTGSRKARPPQWAKSPAPENHKRKDSPGSRWVPTQKVGPDPEGGSRVRDRSRASRSQSRTSPPPVPDLVSPLPPRLAGLQQCENKLEKHLGSRRVQTQKVGPDPKAGATMAADGSRPRGWVPTQKHRPLKGLLGRRQ